jgi:2-haloacid dehalogenase
MKAYDALRVFPEIPAALNAVAEHDSIEAYIFSNGTDDMVKASVETSPDLGPFSKIFKGSVTVHGLQVFKPDRRVYDDLVAKVGKEGRAGEVWVITANPFDAVGAKAAGLQSAWIDRLGKGWIDQLGEVIGGIKPTVVATGVDEAIHKIINGVS